MPASDDLLVGKIALQLKYIDRKQLDECVRIQESGTPKLPLGEILRSRDYIDPAQLERILQIQKKNLSAPAPAHRSGVIVSTAFGILTRAFLERYRYLLGHRLIHTIVRGRVPTVYSTQPR